MDETPRKRVGPGPGRTMARLAALAALAALALAAMLVLAAGLGLRLWPGTAMPVLERVLAQAGVRLHVQALDMGLFPLVVEARGLTLETGEVLKTGGAEEQAGPGLRLRADRVAARTHAWLGLGGGPILESLEVRGLDMVLDLAGESTGDEAGAAGNPLDTALEYLDMVDRVGLSGAVRLRGQGLDMAALGLGLAMESAPDRTRSLRLDARMDLTAPARATTMTLAGTVGLEAVVRGQGKAWDVSALDLALTDFQVDVSGMGEGVGVRATGGRAWLQAGLRLPGAMPLVQRAHLALEGVAWRVATGPDPGQEAAGLLDMEAEVRTRGSRLEMDNCRLLVTGLEAPGLGLGRLPDLALRARGGLDAPGPDPAVWIARLDAVDLRLGDLGQENLLEARGTAESAPGLGNWRADLSGRADRAGAVLDLLRPLLPQGLRKLAVSGSLPVRARLDPNQGPNQGPDQGPDLGLTLGLMPQGLGLRLPGPGLSVLVDGDLGLDLPLGGQARLAGTLTATGDARAAGLGLRRAVLQARLDGPLDRPNLPELRLTAPGNGLDWRGAVLPLGRVDLACAVRWADKGLEVRDLDLAMAALGRVRGSLDLPLADPLAGHGRLAATGLDLSGAGQVLQALGLLPKDAPLPGGATDLSLSLDQDHGPALALDAAFRDAALATADQSVLVDKGAGRVSARVRPGRKGSLAVDLALTSGQVLAGTVFLDMAATPLTLRAKASGDGAGGLVDASGVLEMAGLGTLDLHWGALTRPAPGHGTWTWAGRADLRDLRLPGLLETFVRQPLAFTHPDLAGLTAQGDLSLDISLAVEPEAWSMAGRLVLARGEAAWEAKGVHARGLEANLPFAYVFDLEPGGPDIGEPGLAPPADPAQWGRLACASLATPTGTIQDLALDLALVPGGLFTRGTVSVPVLGGRLELGDVRVDEPLSTRFLARMPVRLEGVDLAQLHPAGVPLEGSLSGDLGLVRVGLDRLSAPGTLAGTFFGGELFVTGLGMARPLDQGRVTGIGQARVQGLDLERLSAALDVGRITGRMDIELDDAAVAWGQPQRLNLRILSVPAPDVPQLVSLKAVNSIAVIGTGSGLTGAGVGMFASFFKEFGYERIGIACALRNDVFTVRGLIRQGGVEYLIKKPLLFGINVVNQNPDNRISFTDMMERIGRVVGGPSGKGPGPKESP